MINLPTTRPILVLSNYRTGSTALCDYISKKLNFVNLDEFFHRTKTNYDITSYSNFVVKVQPDQIVQPWFDYLLESCFVVGIYRKSVVDQIASLYVAQKNNQWHHKFKSADIEFEVEINANELENQIRYVFDMQSEYQKLKQHLNLEFAYEDLHQILESTDYVPSGKPTNLTAIKKFIQDYVDQEMS